MKRFRPVYLLATLLMIGLVRPSFSAEPTTRPTDKKVIRVALYEDKGANDNGRKNVRKCLGVSQSDFEIFSVTAEDIRDGKLKDADVLIQSGGRSVTQAKELNEEGREAVRQFVRNGGGYVGICAGANAATNDHEWGIGLINAKVIDKEHWARGMGNVELKLTDAGRKMFSLEMASVPCVYWQGPLLAPADEDKPGMAKFTPLATFGTEVKKKGVKGGYMVGATAIATTTFDKGRVLLFSPHPERSPGLDRFIRNAVKWVACHDLEDSSTPTLEAIPDLQVALKTSVKTPTTKPTTNPAEVAEPAMR